jgi:hypothetical protein
MNRRKLNTLIKVFIPLGTPSLVLSTEDGEELKTEAVTLFFNVIY